MTTATEFQLRRKRATYVAVPWIAVGLLGLGMTSFFFAGKDLQELLFIVFFVAAMSGALIGLWLYRCPNCNKVPNDDGILFNPTSCPTCGAQLK